MNLKSLLRRLVRVVPYPVRAAVLDLQPRQLRRNRLVADHLRLPEEPHISWLDRLLVRNLNYVRRRADVTEQIWGITVVRNEEDIIGFTIEHLLAEGIDHVMIADNLSDDGTLEVLKDMALRFPVTVLEDRLDAHYQGTKMTLLARWASAHGARWIIPFDADELWYSSSGRLRDVLDQASARVAIAQMWGHVPVGTDDEQEQNPYRRIRMRAATRLDATKVAFRSHPWARVFDGNHSVRVPGARACLLEIRHFPYRDNAQMLKKLKLGGKALEATDLQRGTGYQWRRLSALDDEQILEQVRSGSTGLTHPDPNDRLLDDLAPFRPMAGQDNRLGQG